MRPNLLCGAATIFLRLEILVIPNWRALTLDMPVYDLRMAMQDTREERVRLLEGFLQSLGNRSSAKEETAFLVGYLVSWSLREP